MPKITIDVPDAVYDRVVEGFAKRYRYREKDDNGNPNPKNKKQFLKDTIIGLIKDAVKVSEADDAREKAGKEAVEKVDEEIQLS